MVDENNIAKQSCSKKSILWLICAVIFVSGIAIGAGGTILLVRQRVIWVGHPHKNSADITKEISEKYGLNPQQTQQVRQIIDNAFQQKKQSDDEADKRREAGIRTVVAEMNEVLTPEQFERWNKDFQAFREKHKKPAKK